MRSRHAFTLVELLVVITIIGILIAMLLPAVQSARESARNSQCANNLKQIGLALLSYETQHGSFPPGKVMVSTSWPCGDCRTNWALSILPFLEASNLYDQYDDNLMHCHADNIPVLQTFLPIMLCPSDVGTDQLADASQVTPDYDAAPGSYKGVSGAGPTYWWWWPHGCCSSHQGDRRGPLYMTGNMPDALPPVQTAHITDGLTNTLLVGEYHTLSGRLNSVGPFWASSTTNHNLGMTWSDSCARGLPDYYACDALCPGWGRCASAYASLHSGNMMNFVTCGGSVIRISPNMDGALYEAAGTIAGREVLFLE